ncbi:hypothetical protein ACFX19_002457 [Malus domestica]
MSTSRSQKCLLFTLVFALIVLSEASRLPNWDQMLPKKLPTPASSPSKGTNSATKSSSKALEASRNLPSSDGKYAIRGVKYAIRGNALIGGKHTQL